MMNNTQRLTKETMAGKRFFFRPLDEAAVLRIAEKLLAMGYRWEEYEGTATRVRDTLTSGLVATEKKIIGPQTTTLRASVSTFKIDYAFFGTEEQLDESYLSPEDRLVVLFNDKVRQMTAQIEQLSAEVSDLKNGLQPKSLDKAQLKGPNP